MVFLKEFLDSVNLKKNQQMKFLQKSYPAFKELMPVDWLF